MTVRKRDGDGDRIRIGCGAGFANDRIDAARDLAERGVLDFLFFEGLAERTLAQHQLARAANPEAGFNPGLIRRLRAVLPACRAHGTRIVTNMGAANPRGAGLAAVALAREMGHAGLRIAVVEGDDVAHLMRPETRLTEGGVLADIAQPLIAANAYLGADPIADALDACADIVITGRVADPSLVLGPLIHAFGWSRCDWALLGAGTLVGHLLECGFHITGGYFADPGRKEVPGLAWLGYPFADVRADGSAVIGKLDGTGGLVSRETVLEQLLYEVGDPAAYLTPDVTADFSATRIVQTGPDVVAVTGGTGRARPDRLKVSLGFGGGVLAEAEISYAGRGATARARLAGQVVTERMTVLHGCTDLMRMDLIGVASLHATAQSGPDAQDVRLRIAMRTADPQMAETLVHEVETLWIAGPAGGGGARGRITPTVMARSALIDRARVTPRVEVLVA
ncbi:MAG: acyclic terpene utilization AtuA family protein [Gemmobacter sp.]|nr:acyclic terpene utilization AtuA family protein [Gemmobacter sp.]